MPKPGNLNILGSYDTQVSEAGPLWPSCLCDGQGAVRRARQTGLVGIVMSDKTLNKFSLFCKLNFTEPDGRLRCIDTPHVFQPFL